MKLKSTDWLHLLLVSSGIFLFVLDLFIINVSIPALKQGLNLADSSTQFVIILYIIPYASLLIISGKAGEFFGRKQLFTLGLLGFTLSSAVCGLATNGIILLIGRIFQGLSSGLMVPQGIALIAVLFTDQHKRLWAMGMYGSIAGIASVVGQLLGGLLPDLHGMEEPWRLIFLINVPIGVLALVFVRRRLPESKKTPFQKLDLLGMLLIVTFLVCAIFPLIVGPENQWPYWCFGSLAFSIVIFIFFLRKQQTQHLTGAAALIDLKLLKNRGYQIGLGAAIAYYMVQDAYFIIHSLYLQNELHFTSSYTGLAFFFQGLGYVVASLYASKRVVYKGKMVVCVGIGIMVLALLSHLFLFSQSSISNLGLFVVLFIYGIGCGTVLPSLMTMALKDIPPQEVGVASGIYLTIQQLAICLGIALLVGIYLHQANAPVDLIKTISGAYVYSNILSVVLLLLVAVLTMNMPPFAANHAYTKNNKSIHVIKSTKKVD